MIVAFINCSTSVFGGFAIFSLLGFMAHTTNQPVESVVDDGKVLARKHQSYKYSIRIVVISIKPEDYPPYTILWKLGFCI